MPRPAEQSADLVRLRLRAETLRAAAEEARTQLLETAVAQAITSHRYGHVSAVAREAGVAVQQLRELINKHHPGWLDQAAQQRAQEKNPQDPTAGGA